MNLRLLSDGSDHGTTRTGSSAEHSADHSESITHYLSVSEGCAKPRRFRRAPEEIAVAYVPPNNRHSRSSHPAAQETHSAPHVHSRPALCQDLRLSSRGSP